MAITKIHAIKATVNKAIEYICNPAKTDDSIYISSFACAAETAAYDFKYTLDHANDFGSIEKAEKENKAFHLIQAFAPDEVSYEEAHTIGKELADKLLEGKYSYVLTTHIDHCHVHNHLIFCAVDHMEHKHYHDCKKSYWNIRKLSDQICKEHHLSVVAPSKERGKTYKEWSENQNGTSWKTQLRKDINQGIKATGTYEEFLALMKAKGYELKNEDFDKDSGKYIAFRPLGEKNFIRGRANSLGANFTKERIKERIEEKSHHAVLSSSNRKRTKTLIDVSADPKYLDHVGLRKWAAKENLKIAADTFNRMTAKGIHTLAKLDEKITYLHVHATDSNASIVALEAKIRDTAELIKYAEQYRHNKPYQDRYERAKDQDKYLRKYESHLILFSGAKHMLERKRIAPNQMHIEQMKQHYQALLDEKHTLLATHKASAAERKDLELLKKNMAQYLKLQPHEYENDDTIKKTQRLPTPVPFQSPLH